MPAAIDITGHRYNSLTVIEKSGFCTPKGTPKWKCICDCGEEVYVTSGELRRSSQNGRTAQQSCGCYRTKKAAERAKLLNASHGLTGHPLYSVWCSMKRRCYNENDKMFRCYGARGIQICDEWKQNFMKFYLWAIANGYKKGLTIERINNDGNYCSDNCRWATSKEQQRNKRTNVLLTYNGKTQCQADWEEELGLPSGIVRKRRARGWSVEKALKLPPI